MQIRRKNSHWRDLSSANNVTNVSRDLDENIGKIMKEFTLERILLNANNVTNQLKI